ncbi:MAG: hypothetical protein IT337_12820 [Thermomicrobiales bacterium]|nr:hypothetical protein [Thermomicrobiales bacterium]
MSSSSDSRAAAETQVGICNGKGQPVASLEPATPNTGSSNESSETQNAAPSSTNIGVSLDSLLGSDHSVVLKQGPSEVALCGEIGGVADADRSMVVGIREVSDRSLSSVTYLAPASDPGLTGAWLVLAADDLGPFLFLRSTNTTRVESEEIEPAAPAELTDADKMADYPWLLDGRELAIRPGNMIGDKVAFIGSIMTIQVATPGNTVVMGDPKAHFFEAGLQVTVAAPDGSTEVVSVGYDGDTSGMFEGAYVSVHGTVIGARSGTNRLRGSVSQPLGDAEFVVIS